jgi:hypothetical protein
MGMTFDPDVIAAGKKALDEFGSGTTGSRVLNGTYSGHRAVEQALKDFYAMDHAMVFSTGYQANLGVISTLAGKEDFLTLAARYSDDPDRKRNGGDMGFNHPSSFVEPVRNQIAKMTTKGEISPPGESSYRFHIVRFVERRKPDLATFGHVKKSLIAAERERLVKKGREEAIGAVRNSSTVVVHLDKIQSLIVPIEDVLKRASAGGPQAK